MSVYLDHNATAPLRPVAVEAMKEAMARLGGNPSSPHSFGRQARKLLEDSRTTIARCLGVADPTDVIFTSGATEANHLALADSDATIAADTEHPSVLANAPNLLRLRVDENGIIDLNQLETLLESVTATSPRQSQHSKNPQSPQSPLQSTPPQSPQSPHKNIKVAVMAANNETGVLLPHWERVYELCAEFGAKFHCDLSQWVGKLPLPRFASQSVAELTSSTGAELGVKAGANPGANLGANPASNLASSPAPNSAPKSTPPKPATNSAPNSTTNPSSNSATNSINGSSLAHSFVISAHKFGGPQGIGALVADPKTLTPQIKGGGQEQKLRSGTENTIAACGFAAALTDATEQLDAYGAKVEPLRDEFEAALKARFKGATILGQKAQRLPNTCCFALPHISGELAVLSLDLAGFGVSSGSACSSGKMQPSAVATAMGYGDQIARGAIRVSLGMEHTSRDIHNALIAIAKIVAVAPTKRYA